MNSDVFNEFDHDIIYEALAQNIISPKHENHQVTCCVMLKAER